MCCYFWHAYPSTQGSGRNVTRLIPITLMIVLIADIPSHPELRATLAGYKQKHHWYEQYYNKNLINHDGDTSVLLKNMK